MFKLKNVLQIDNTRQKFFLSREFTNDPIFYSLLLKKIHNQIRLNTVLLFVKELNVHNC